MRVQRKAHGYVDPPVRDSFSFPSDLMFAISKKHEAVGIANNVDGGDGYPTVDRR